ncbi:MAG TPA: hypothetical protein VGQ39_15800 [Pyrinomonadaceae bacterium]|jgi:hypothetical protein|nr:hypothetical protein [Pyrinomonadaceae bacterium]
MKKFVIVLMLCIAPVTAAQQNTTSNEKRVSLSEPAVAFDATGASALEASLITTGLNGAPDTPVTNTRLVVRNTSAQAYAFASGIVTFYDSAGVRCGEGLFKADALAANESFETDTPGIRIRCSPTSWRLVATNLVPRVVPGATPTTARLVISIDGEQHPLQLDKPLTLDVGGKQRTIIVREGP